MKIVGLLCVTALAAQAAVLEFDISPPGSDAAVGLSPLNEVPAVTNSMGSGGELIGYGVFYDTDAGLLMLSLGYGQAAMFTNLTGEVTQLGLYEGAAGEASTNLIQDLADWHFVSAQGATNGGIIYGAILIDTNMAQALIDGLWHVNLHTATNPAGEIRGQLILANSAPVIICPEDVTEECGEPTDTEILVSDADGDEVTVDWLVDGVLMGKIVVAGDAALAGTNIVVSAEYPLGTNLLEFVATDAIGNESSCSTTVVVEDTTPPVIKSPEASPNSLWPVNHKMVMVNVEAEVQDACGSAEWSILGVTSNEPINGTGDGNTEPDWEEVEGNPHAVLLRAERAGNLTGRVYRIELQATDESGNVSDSSYVEVIVPHDQRSNRLRSWLRAVWR